MQTSSNHHEPDLVRHCTDKETFSRRSHSSGNRPSKSKFSWKEYTFHQTTRHFTNKRETGASKLLQRLLGLTSASPVTIPETIAGHISAPVPLSFLKWRMPISPVSVMESWAAKTEECRKSRDRRPAVLLGLIHHLSSLCMTTAGTVKGFFFFTFR